MGKKFKAKKMTLAEFQATDFGDAGAGDDDASQSQSQSQSQSRAFGGAHRSGDVDVAALPTAPSRDDTVDGRFDRRREGGFGDRPSRFRNDGDEGGNWRGGSGGGSRYDDGDGRRGGGFGGRGGYDRDDYGGGGRREGGGFGRSDGDGDWRRGGDEPSGGSGAFGGRRGGGSGFGGGSDDGPSERPRLQLKPRSVDAGGAPSRDGGDGGRAPRADPFGGAKPREANMAERNEYVAECDQRRSFISGFTGSAGTALITSSEALLWTDGRYFLQASQQLDAAHWKLMKSGMPDVPTLDEWVGEALASRVLGVDPFTVSASMMASMRDPRRGVTIRALDRNPVDDVWGSARPARTANPLRALPLELTGASTTSKLEAVRLTLARQNCSALIVASLDELTNLRGADISFNPVFFAYGVVTRNAFSLFCNEQQVRSSVPAEALAGITLRPYEDVREFLAKQVSAEPGACVWLDPQRTCDAVAAAVKCAKHEDMSPIQAMKAVKNAAELRGMQEAHNKDGAALCSFFAWLEERMASGEPLSECEAADKVEEFRAQQPGFVSNSFDAISSTGPNGAIIHYKPQPDSCRTLSVDEVYLLDSGGQYVEGTTDTTRTIAFKRLGELERTAYTLVLKGHLELGRCIFPDGAQGCSLDPMARKHLWTHGMDFRHGTGHGVGSFLNVHEGPHQISSRNLPATRYPLRVGMTTSNEPGYYEDGKFGVRIENVCHITEVETPMRFGGKYLQLRDFTLVPYDVMLMEPSLLTDEEVAQVDTYHDRVRADIMPLLRDERSRAWLERRTRPLVEQFAALA